MLVEVGHKNVIGCVDAQLEVGHGGMWVIVGWW